MKTHGTKNVRFYTICILTLLLVSCGGSKELIVLLEGEDGKTGALTVETGKHTVVLDAPLAAAKIDAQGRVTKAVLTDKEVQRSFATALKAQPPEPVTFRLYFEENETKVKPEYAPVLEALFAEVARRKAVEVQVTGHTDRVGTVDRNDRLSLERARLVRDMLIERNLQAEFVRAVGRGERAPLVPTPDEQREPRNRRVVVVVR